MFKYWQLYHTNKRNKLARKKLLKIMHIKKDVLSHERSKKSHLMPCRGSSSKNGIGNRDGSRMVASQQPNRIVSPEERPRLNSTYVEGGIKEDESRSKNVGVEEPYYEESVDEDDAFIVSFWMDALSNVLPDEQGDYDEIDGGCFDYINHATLAGLSEKTTDDPPEQRPESLLALPEANMASFPQEYGHYLSKLNFFLH